MAILLTKVVRNPGREHYAAGFQGIQSSVVAVHSVTKTAFVQGFLPLDRSIAKDNHAIFPGFLAFLGQNPVTEWTATFGNVNHFHF